MKCWTAVSTRILNHIRVKRELYIGDDSYTIKKNSMFIASRTRTSQFKVWESARNIINCLVTELVHFFLRFWENYWTVCLHCVLKLWMILGAGKNLYSPFLCSISTPLQNCKTFEEFKSPKLTPVKKASRINALWIEKNKNIGLSIDSRHPSPQCDSNYQL